MIIRPLTQQGFIDPHKVSDDSSSSGIGVESASKFETGNLSSGSSQSEDTPPQEGWEVSEQVMRYKQQKPKKAKDVTSRECVWVWVCG